MDKIKVSWTILSNWSAGRKDEAARMLAGIEMEANPAMERGKRMHEVIAKNKLKLIPEISDSAIFENINPEKNEWTNYFKVAINDWLDLSLVIDVLDPMSGLIVDWKASRLRSSEHNKMQIYLYALAMNKTGIKIDKGVYATIDEALSDGGIFCRDYSMFKINQEKLELAENYVETVGGEIYEFLKS